MKTFLISASVMVMMLLSCQSENKAYAPEGLTKLTNAEIIQRLKDKVILNPQNLEFQSTDGLVLKEDSVRTLFIAGETYGDQYVDKEGNVKVMILRKMEEADKTFLEELSAVQKKMMEEEMSKRQNEGAGQDHSGHDHSGHDHDHAGHSH